jgi:succinate dehydrogenase flavin-adding protein (antitoxin of CptAB toxin-antitoxin module)
MRELDVLLLRYLENDYPQGSEEEKAAFRELLALSDPELRAYLLAGEQTGQPATDKILRQMRH